LLTDTTATRMAFSTPRRASTAAPKASLNSANVRRARGIGAPFRSTVYSIEANKTGATAANVNDEQQLHTSAPLWRMFFLICLGDLIVDHAPDCGRSTISSTRRARQGWHDPPAKLNRGRLPQPDHTTAKDDRRPDQHQHRSAGSAPLPARPGGGAPIR